MSDASSVPIVPRKTVDWQPVREAFVRRPTRATYDELSVEFAVSPAAVARVAADEGWTALRARYLESQIQASDAAEIVLNMARGDRTITTAYLSLAIVVLATLQGVAETVRNSENAPSTKADALNTCAFAAKNMADALRSVGIIGAGKVLGDGAQKENGRWNPEMLQQINVTVQNLTAQQASKPPSESGPAVPVDAK